MAVAIAFEEAKKKQFRFEPHGDGSKGGVSNTPFFGSLGSRGDPDSPQAFLAQFDPGKTSGTHFHMRDQFQVAVAGKGKLGRHDLTPYCVHFSRAYTPYGPLLSDANTGLTCFVIRARSDTGAQHLPQALANLKQVAIRQPWQITRTVAFPALDSDATADVMLQAIPDIRDEQGLAAYTLSMKPNVQANAPDPSAGDGQYLLVVKGSLLHDNRQHEALTMVYVGPKEGPFRFHAGPVGMQAIVLNFPLFKPRTARPKTPSAAGLRKWQCALCSFSYDEALGIPEEGIPAGTRWEDVPDTWSCPDCSASKVDFQMVELKY